MKRYIDADLLRKEIESRMGDCDANSKNPNQLLWAELAALIPFIDSLQQEQDLIVINKKTWEAQEQFRKNKDFGKPLQQEQPCDTCTNDKGCVTCKDGELWEGKEQPCEELEEEIDSFWNKVSGFSPKFTTLEVKRNGLGVIARHFANWQKEQMPMPEDTVIFQKGIEEGKRLMMEDAVEGEVCKDHIVTEKPFYFYQSRLIELPDNLKEGDKVKIVIVKEDKK